MNKWWRRPGENYQQYAERKWIESRDEHQATARRWNECARRASQANDIEHREHCIREAGREDNLAEAAHRRARECRAGVDVSAPGDDTAW